MSITSKEIRKKFLDYFSGHNHLILESASLVPINDPTLLVVNSGMAPLKPYFTGEQRPPQQRLCNIQKCVRTNDIESVGDRHHLTFFEMMGNWSIGDYFKEEAVDFAWDLLKKGFGFDLSQMYATVFGGDKKFPAVPPDEESKVAWEKYLPKERIISLGAKFNFWGPAGETGPCGPCTEIFIDRGKDYGCGRDSCDPSCDCERFLEIWNAGVFMEYYLDENGNLRELPLKSVDAGAGLDRFAVILQGVDSVYETDLLSPIVEVFAPKDNLASKSIRIMTDHLRCATFMIADGIYPANTKREYIVRRIIRRALLHARLAEKDPESFIRATKVVVELFSPYYPELVRSQGIVEMAIRRETATFGKMLNRGLKELEKVFSRFQEIISGADAFKLYETYGFPLELTKEIAAEKSLKVDEEGYKNQLEKHKERSRQAKGGVQ
jgi:alanyl-tRNA synthetase